VLSRDELAALAAYLVNQFFDVFSKPFLPIRNGF